mmetsp:Transcript_75464/g.209641  ORF Transcript_75464/g.209641 Transcript_75464/m.209641 type:complete len:409 (-) Transcript_75464:4-1230(-)
MPCSPRCLLSCLDELEALGPEGKEPPGGVGGDARCAVGCGLCEGGGGGCAAAGRGCAAAGRGCAAAGRGFLEAARGSLWLGARPPSARLAPAAEALGAGPIGAVAVHCWSSSRSDAKAASMKEVSALKTAASLASFSKALVSPCSSASVTRASMLALYSHSANLARSSLPNASNAAVTSSGTARPRPCASSHHNCRPTRSARASASRMQRHNASKSSSCDNRRSASNNSGGAPGSPAASAWPKTAESAGASEALYASCVSALACTARSDNETSQLVHSAQTTSSSSFKFSQIPRQRLACSPRTSCTAFFPADKDSWTFELACRDMAGKTTRTLERHATQAKVTVPQWTALTAPQNPHLTLVALPEAPTLAELVSRSSWLARRDGRDVAEASTVAGRFSAAAALPIASR